MKPSVTDISTRKTYDQSGKLLGDDTGVTDPTAPVGSAANPMQLPEMDVTAPAPFDFSQLLKPPYVFLLFALVALGAYVYGRERR